MTLDWVDINMLNCGLAGIIWMLALYHQEMES